MSETCPSPIPQRVNVHQLAGVLFFSLMLAGCGVLGGGSPSASLPVDKTAAADSDGDGIPDARDACPDTQLTAGVDAEGCSPFNGPVAGVDFSSGGAQLGVDARAALEPLVQAMQAHPAVRLEVQGHTDNRGPARENLDLSKRRVMAVVRYLVSSGVAPDRLEPIAFGESRPVQRNATAEGRAANRRIEVRAIVP